VCKGLNVNDNPRNSECIEHIRYIPIQLLDVAGLVPGAHKGRGLGNKFLSDLSRADALIHIIDITGSLDANGNNVDPGTHDPYNDILFLEEEINFWFRGIIEREDWRKFSNRVIKRKSELIEALYLRLSGLSIKKEDVEKSIKNSNLDGKPISEWHDEELTIFSKNLREISKPIVIVANKIDKEIGIKKLEELKKKYKKIIIPCSALAEVALRKYGEVNVIKYMPGDSDFSILKTNSLNRSELETLEKIKQKILKRYGGTGVQKALNYAVFSVLNQISVYPVANLNSFTDKDNNILPDVFLIRKGTKLREFVKDKIHSDLAKHFIYGMEVKSKMKLGENYILKDNDIVKIFSAK